MPEADTRVYGLSPIQTRSATEEVYLALRTAILDGVLAPGSRLGEESLAENLHASRTPVREALVRLELAGLAKAGRRGVFVRRFSHQELVERYELRSVLEGHATLVAAEHATPEDAELLVKLCDEVDERLEIGFTSEAARIGWLVDSNRQFHNAIHRIVPNKTLIQAVQNASELPFIYRAAFWRAPAQSARALHYHRTIARAFVAQEARRAAGVMQEHIAESRDLTLEFIKESQGEQLLELMQLMEVWVNQRKLGGETP